MYRIYSTTFIRVFSRPHKHVAKSDNEMHVSICVLRDCYCCPILTKAVLMQKIRAISSLIQNFMDILSKVFEQWHAHRHKDVQCEFVSRPHSYAVTPKHRRARGGRKRSIKCCPSSRSRENTAVISAKYILL